jgi:hypothetical protein
MYSSESLRRSYVINDRYLGDWKGKKVYISNKEDYIPGYRDECYYVLYDYNNAVVNGYMVYGHLGSNGNIFSREPYKIPYLMKKEPKEEKKEEKIKSAETKEVEVVKADNQPSSPTFSFSFSGLEDLEKEMEKLIVGLECGFDEVTVDF